MQKKTTLTMLSLLLVTGCHKEFIIGEPDNHIAPQFWGVWQSADYGYILNLDHEISLYDHTERFCQKQTMSREQAQEHFAVINSMGPNQIGIANSPQSKIYVFDRINQVPEHCFDDIADTAINNFEYFVDLMSSHYAYFDLYEIDWKQRVKTHRPRVHNNSTPKELARVFQDLIEGINDSHLFVKTGLGDALERISNDDSRELTPALDRAFKKQSKIKDRREFGLAWYGQILENIADGLVNSIQSAANDQLIWGDIDGVGYIKIRNMHGFTDGDSLAQELKVVAQVFTTIISDLSHTDQLIIDLTTNSGGSDEIGRLVASYFTNEPRLLYSHNTLNQQNQAQQHHVKPATTTYQGTVYVLTSDHTVSAAETFAMAMKALPNTTHVGSRTRGAFSDILDKTLPNGWEVGLSNMFYWDAQGINWEGQGLQPDTEFPVFSRPDIFKAHHETVTELVSRVKSGNR